MTITAVIITIVYAANATSIHNKTKCTITTGYNYMGQESWHSGYIDKGNEKYKNDYCQNVLKNDSISISLLWVSGSKVLVVGKSRSS